MKLERLKGRGAEYLYRHPEHKTIYFRRYTKETGEFAFDSAYFFELDKRDRKYFREIEGALIAFYRPAFNRQINWVPVLPYLKAMIDKYVGIEELVVDAARSGIYSDSAGVL